MAQPQRAGQPRCRWATIVALAITSLACATTPPPAPDQNPESNPPLWGDGVPDLQIEPQPMADSDWTPPEPDEPSRAREMNSDQLRLEGIDFTIEQQETDEIGLVDLRIEVSLPSGPVVIEHSVDIDACMYGFPGAKLIERQGNEVLVDVRLLCELGMGKIRQHLVHNVLLIDRSSDRVELLWTGYSELIDAPYGRTWDWHRFEREGDTLIIRREHGDECGDQDDTGLWKESWRCPGARLREVGRVDL